MADVAVAGVAETGVVFYPLTPGATTTPGEEVNYEPDQLLGR